MNTRLVTTLMPVAVLCIQGCNTELPDPTQLSGQLQDVQTKLEQKPATLTCDAADDPLVGCWQSEHCQTLVPDNTSATGFRRHFLAFRKDGALVQVTRIYDNASCNGVFDISVKSPLKETYTLGKSITTESGLAARVLDVSLELKGHTREVFTIVSTDGDRLCFGKGDYRDKGVAPGLLASAQKEDDAPVALDLEDCLERRSPPG